ncbi:MAG: helix-turn-helix domain-containing protein [Gammaproteobacteria bacterium]|nr:helix-turn-helix domain-containing protein [Gammaproteobacteria bacterium]
MKKRSYPTYLTLDELAAYLKISRAKLYRMSQDAKIPASKIGNQWRFSQEEVNTWMKNQRPLNITCQQEEKALREKVE